MMDSCSPQLQVAGRISAGDRSVSDEDQLDFQQAMTDFRHMFPSMDPRVIEAVLRNNNGAVDDTIDQLLVMAMDVSGGGGKHSLNDGGVDDLLGGLLTQGGADSPSPSSGRVEQETLPKTIDDCPESPQQLYLNLPPMRQSGRSSNSSSPRNTSSPSWARDPRTGTLPMAISSLPQKQYSAQEYNRPIHHIPEPDCISPDLLLTDLFGPPPAYSKVVGNGNQSNSNKKGKIYRPPLIGSLPADFLRLSEHSGDSHLSSVSNTIGAKSPRTPKSPQKQNYQWGNDGAWVQKSAEFPYGATLGIFHTSGRPTKHQHKGLEHASTLSGLSLRRKKQYKETAKQAEKLKDMMLDNQFRRQVASDPELEQYLEDERIAIMLQNREFMRELRRNRDFMSALERDRMFASAEEERMVKKAKKLSLKEAKLQAQKSRGSQGSCSSRGSASSPRTSTSAEPQAVFHEKFEVLDSPSREESVFEGYGDDEPVTAEPFPYTKTLQKSDEQSEMAFREKLRFMGKSSKQKFAMIARKFVRKSKGAKGVLGTSDSHHSDMLLLEAVDDADYGGEDSNVQAGYNQPGADQEYNIGQRRDLKEGRLFTN